MLLTPWSASNWDSLSASTILTFISSPKLLVTSINTGLYDVTISKSFLGDAKPDMSTVLTQLQSDGYNNNASVRQPNYLFGY